MCWASTTCSLMSNMVDIVLSRRDGCGCESDAFSLTLRPLNLCLTSILYMMSSNKWSLLYGHTQAREIRCIENINVGLVY